MMGGSVAEGVCRSGTFCVRTALLCNVYNMYAYVHAYNIHVLMRDEKEGRKKQARSSTYVY